MFKLVKGCEQPRCKGLNSPVKGHEQPVQTHEQPYTRAVNSPVQGHEQPSEGP